MWQPIQSTLENTTTRENGIIFKLKFNHSDWYALLVYLKNIQIYCVRVLSLPKYFLSEKVSENL